MTNYRQIIHYHFFIVGILDCVCVHTFCCTTDNIVHSFQSLTSTTVQNMTNYCHSHRHVSSAHFISMSSQCTLVLPQLLENILRVHHQSWSKSSQGNYSFIAIKVYDRIIMSIYLHKLLIHFWGHYPVLSMKMINDTSKVYWWLYRTWLVWKIFPVEDFLINGCWLGCKSNSQTRIYLIGDT